MASWYEASYFNWHVDYHVRPHSATGAGMTAERLRGILQRIKPDMVQVDAKGHPGLASYPTRVGATSENYARDTLRLYRDVTTALGLPLSVYYSTLVDNFAGERHPEWCIVKSDGTLDTWFSEVIWSRLCFNSGYVDDYMLPQLSEICREYQPDGFWFDGDAFTGRLCYCPACEAQFRIRTGQALPRDVTAPLYPEALRFLRDSYSAYVAKIRATLRQTLPECQMSVNWLQTLRSPGLAPGTVDWLSGDVPVSRSAPAASAEARYIGAQDLPGDIMICQFTADENWERLYYKAPEHQAQEAAVIMANGARVFLWTSPMLDGSIHEDAVELLDDLARFIRARQRWCQDTTSVREVALFLPRAPFETSPLLRHEPPALKRLLAAQHLLVNAGQHHDIISDAHHDRFSQWPVIVVAGLADLTAEDVAALDVFVQSGGCLLASAPLDMDASGHVRPDLAALTGVTQAVATDIRIVRTDVGPSPTRVFYAYWQLNGAGLSPHGTLWDAQTGALLPAMPERVAYQRGKGRVLTFCGDVFEGYQQVQAPVLRQVVMRGLRQIYPVPAAMLEPCGQIEVAVRQKMNGDWLVHLVNRGADRDMSGSNYFVEKVPPAGARKLYLHCPAEVSNVRLQPGDRPVQWIRRDGMVHCDIPEIELYEIVELQVALA